MPCITCRQADTSDAELLFTWANDSKVRKNSFSTAEISLEEHMAWFSKVMTDETVEIYIYYLDNEPIGQVRLNYSGSDVLISYSIAQKFRGQGFGKYVIHDIEHRIASTHTEVKTIHAKVKDDNIASQKIFEDNEYLQMSIDSGIYAYYKTIKHIIPTSNKPELIVFDDMYSKDIYAVTSRERERERERVLLLTNNRNALKLYDALVRIGEDVMLYSGVLSSEQLLHMNPKVVISYNYKYIISEETIAIMHGQVVNLHISYLPWNKGSDPNFWSFIENTPKGVTIHKVDAHLDTGNVLFQKEVFFDEEIETFRTSYQKLNDTIVTLFCENWNQIRSGTAKEVHQNTTGTYHRRSDFVAYTNEHPLNYDETIRSYKNKYNLQ